MRKLGVIIAILPRQQQLGRDPDWAGLRRDHAVIRNVQPGQ